MSTRLLFMARVARRRIEVTERDRPCYFGPAPTPKERAYSVRGDKVRDGSFYTEGWNELEAIQHALACARRHNPKAVIRVSYCAPCANAGQTWDVHEGRPSWHQQRAGGIGAAVTSGFKSEQEARDYAQTYRERNPDSPAIVLRRPGVCIHVL